VKHSARALSCSAALVLAAVSFQAPAEAQNRTRVGVLDCDVSGGIGLIVGSRKAMNCTYTPSGQGPREVYTGSIGKFGLDVGATSGGRMVWGVYAATAGGPAALAGTYAGASADASIGAGLGANVLVGGSNRTVALQPLSVQAQAGLNLAVGVSALTLNPVR
jgi:Protein of unknown function (DUF992)